MGGDGYDDVDLDGLLRASRRAEAQPEASETVKWRDFTPLRWAGFVLVIVGGGLLLAYTWWIGILLELGGLGLIRLDNGKRLRLLRAQQG